MLKGILTDTGAETIGAHEQSAATLRCGGLSWQMIYPECIGRALRHVDIEREKDPGPALLETPLAPIPDLKVYGF
jgi:hypothetical protein